MTYTEVLAGVAVGVSVSDSEELPSLGLSDEHVRHVSTEIARHLLALGAELVYGGDLRRNGFTELLVELLSRHRRDIKGAESDTGISSYLAWPVHTSMERTSLQEALLGMQGIARVYCLDLEGNPYPDLSTALALAGSTPTAEQWARGLSAMRRVLTERSHARIVLGGRTTGFLGAAPGIAEESRLALDAKQPLYVMGGFGGCARSITQVMNLAAPDHFGPNETVVQLFSGCTPGSLNNGLSEKENCLLSQTVHLEQAVALILKGLVATFSSKEHQTSRL